MLMTIKLKQNVLSNYNYEKTTIFEAKNIV